MGKEFWKKTSMKISRNTFVSNYFFRGLLFNNVFCSNFSFFLFWKRTNRQFLARLHNLLKYNLFQGVN